MTVPEASGFGLAFGSASASATSRTVSSSVSMPVPSTAETLHELVRAAPVGGDDLALRQLLLARGRGWRPALSTLLTATMNGTSAARAWSMASIVCGMTPSSAATTMTATSVIFAPRARMAVKASWPGRVEEGDLAARRGAPGRRRCAG